MLATARGCDADVDGRGGGEAVAGPPDPSTRSRPPERRCRNALTSPVSAGSAVGSHDGDQCQKPWTKTGSRNRALRAPARALERLRRARRRPTARATTAADGSHPGGPGGARPVQDVAEVARVSDLHAIPAASAAGSDPADAATGGHADPARERERERH